MPDFCCKMRERFLIGIVFKNPNVPDPPELVEFIDFDAATEPGVAIIRTKFCAFCGKTVAGPMRTCPPVGKVVEALESGLICKKCGSPIKSGFCSDETCAYSAHGQDEEIE